MKSDSEPTSELLTSLKVQAAETQAVIEQIAQQLAKLMAIQAVETASPTRTLSASDHRLGTLRRRLFDQRAALARLRWNAAMARADRGPALFSARARVAEAERLAWRGVLKLGQAGEAQFLKASGLWREEFGRIQQTGGVSDGSRSECLDVTSYVAAAKSPNAKPTAFFDHLYYASNSPDVLTHARHSLLTHYIVHGEREVRQPHPLFDILHYGRQLGPAQARLRKSLLAHFLEVGGLRGVDPHPLFSATHYIGQTDAVSESGANPLVHYLTEGWKQGFDPHPLFWNDWYLEQNPDVAEAGIAPLLHYVLRGSQEGRRPHPLFDPVWYARRYPDAAVSSMEPLAHYLSRPASEQRWASPYFDPSAYGRYNPDVAAAGVDPLVHYITIGQAEGRTIAPAFDDAAYFAHDPAAAADNRAAIEHWVAAGTPPLNVRSKSQGVRSVQGEDGRSRGLFSSLAAAAREKSDQFDYHGYHRLRADLEQIRRERVTKAEFTAVPIVEIDVRQIANAVAELEFPRGRAKPKISIIVPTYNNVKFTVECLVALQRHTDLRSVEVIISDDFSLDDTEKLLVDVPGLVFRRNTENLGFIGNCNAAAAEAKGDVLVFLNNDVQVLAGWLTPLRQALDDDIVGAATPKILFPNGRLQEAGGFLHHDGCSELIGLFETPNQPRFAYDRFVDYASGACLAIRKMDFLDLGGFSVQYKPAYCEDADFCYRLRKNGKRVRYVADSIVAHHLSVTSDSMGDDYKTKQVQRNQQHFVSNWATDLEQNNSVRMIAFYLPQYHTIPENDLWWGAGFTEWTNVTRALPNFDGHYQPHRPADLGYYNLDSIDTMKKQAKLARRYGLDGFCFYYYSFNGRRVLEKPVEAVLRDADWSFPFCVCWANENWTRTWDGQNTAVLLEQNYGSDDLDVIIHDLIRHMKHHAYIRIDGKPLLVIYRPGLIPNIAKVVARWRRLCAEAGLGDIHLSYVENFENALTYPDPTKLGFDATIEFPPAGMAAKIPPPGVVYNAQFDGTVCDYPEVVRKYAREPIPGHTRFRGAMPSWDNTARRQDVSYVFQNASPGAFQAWLEHLVAETRLQNYGDERMIFINAWNEWAEGAHLEPDEKFGHGWLEALRNAKESTDVLTKRGERW